MIRLGFETTWTRIRISDQYWLASNSFSEDQFRTAFRCGQAFGCNLADSQLGYFGDIEDCFSN